MTIALATGLTSYIPMMSVDTLDKGLKICKELKEICPNDVFTVVSSDIDGLDNYSKWSWKTIS